MIIRGFLPTTATVLICDVKDISFLHSLWTLRLKDVLSWLQRQSMIKRTLVFCLWRSSRTEQHSRLLWRMWTSRPSSSHPSTSGKFLKMQLWELWLAASVPKTVTQSTVPSGNVNRLNQEEWHLPPYCLHDNDEVDTRGAGGRSVPRQPARDSFLHTVKNHSISNNVTGSVHPFLPLISGYPVHGHIYLILL